MATVAHYENSAFGTGTKTLTAVPWSDGDLIIVVGKMENRATGESINAPTATGLTFRTKFSRFGDNASQSGVGVWYAIATSADTQNIVNTGTSGVRWMTEVWVIAAPWYGFTFHYNETEDQFTRTVADGDTVIVAISDWEAEIQGNTPATGSGTATERDDRLDTGFFSVYSVDYQNTSAGTFDFGASDYTTGTPIVAQVMIHIGGAEPANPYVMDSAQSSVNTAGTSHTVTLPFDIQSTDLVLIEMDIGSTAATLNALTDWTELLDENVGNGLKILIYTGAGVPSNPTFTTSANTRSASVAYRIANADKSGTIQIGTTATGTSANPNPPSVTPTGGVSKAYLALAFFGQAGEEADDDTWVNTPPTGFDPTPPHQKSCGTAGSNLGGKIGSAFAAFTTGSTIDPGSFNVDASAAWRAQTILIHPAPAATTRVQAVAVTAEAFASGDPLEMSFVSTPTPGNLLVLMFGGRDADNNEEPQFVVSDGWEIVAVADPMEFHTVGIAWRQADGTSLDDTVEIEPTGGSVSSGWAGLIEFTNPAITTWGVDAFAFNGAGATDVADIASGSTGALTSAVGVAAIVATSRTNLINLDTDIGDSMTDLDALFDSDAGSANFLGRWLNLTSTDALEVTATEAEGASRMGVGIVVFTEQTAAPQSIDIPTAVLALSSVAPSVAGDSAAEIAVPTASLTLSPVAPTVAPTGAAEIAIAPAALVLSGVSPTLTGDGNVDVAIPPAVLVLEGVAPSLANDPLHAWFGDEGEFAPAADDTPVELGTHFSIDEAFTIVGIRIRNPGEGFDGTPGDRFAKLWYNGVVDERVQLLQLPDTLPAGWSTWLFEHWFVVIPGEDWAVSYNVDGVDPTLADYFIDVNAFAGGPIDFGPGTLDLGAFGAVGLLPTTVFSDSFYGVDLLYFEGAVVPFNFGIGWDADFGTFTEGSDLTLAAEFTFDGDATLVGVRIHSDDAQSGAGRSIYVWEDDGTLLDTFALPDLSAGWNWVEFDTPVDAPGGIGYRIGYDVPTGSEYDSVSSIAPFTRGPITFVEGYFTAALATFPTSDSGNWYGIDPLVEFADAQPQDIAIPTAELVLSGVTPSISGDGASEVVVPPAQMALSGTAPTVAGDGETGLPVPTATLVLEGVPPTLDAPVEIEIPTALLVLSGVSPLIAGDGDTGIVVPPAVVALGALAPEVAPTGDAPIVIPPAVLTLSGLAPTIAGDGEIAFDVPTATLVLSGVSPIITTDEQLVVVPTATLVLSAFSPLVAGSSPVEFAIPTAALALTTLAPVVTAEGAAPIVVPPATLALGGVPPVVTAVGAAPIVVPPATLVLSGSAPTVAGDGSIDVVVPTADLLLSAFAPAVIAEGAATLLVPTATLTLLGVAPIPLGSGEAQLLVPTALLTLLGVVPIVALGNVSLPCIPLFTVDLSTGRVTVTLSPARDTENLSPGRVTTQNC